MLKYVVMCVAKATENNPNFRGETRISYYGKGEENLCTMYSDIPNSFLVGEYGYNRKCDAVRMCNSLARTFKLCEELGVKWTHELSVTTISV